MIEPDKVDALSKFIEEFSSLPRKSGRSSTVLEIAGYPHFENVCSNILAFFMVHCLFSWIGYHGFGYFIHLGRNKRRRN